MGRQASPSPSICPLFRNHLSGSTPRLRPFILNCRYSGTPVSRRAADLESRRAEAGLARGTVRRMMTLGTTGAFGFEDFHPPAVLGHYARAGCEVVQVYRNRQRQITPRDILSVVSALPLRIDSMHGVFGDDLDPSSEDESVRRQTVETY